MWGLEEHVVKGYYPHLFNKKENWNYEGEIPDKKYFCPEQMKSSDKEKFIKWWNKKKDNNYIWNNKDELRKYCSNDVFILRKSCEKYREIMLEIAETDPWNFITIASTAQHIHRKDIMPKNTIAYYRIIKQSKACAEWLSYLENFKEIKIIREYKIPKTNFIADGYCKETNTIFEFNGDKFHGNPAVYNPKEKANISRDSSLTHGDLDKKTKEKKQRLQDLGYIVEDIYECVWNSQKKNEKTVINFMKTYKPDLVIRDAFNGGRTNTEILYWKKKFGETLRYLDFTSLYPWVQKYCAFPIGFDEQFKNVSVKEYLFRYKNNAEKYFGVIFCKVKPPKDLAFPVLPSKHEGKLKFTLHEQEGTWSTIEIDKAIDMGYELLEIYEIRHWKQRNKNVFAPYIDKFLKIKQESCGFPAWVKTEDDKNKYILNYYVKEGILLDKTEIKDNPGKKAVAKFYLVSIFGKYVQRLNKMKTKIINNPCEFYNMIFDEDYKVSYDFAGIEGNEKCIMSYKYKEECFDGPDKCTTSEIIGVMTTAYARLKLYDLCEKVGFDNVLYTDTDSCIYIEKEGINDHVYKNDQGDYLGQLTNELYDKKRKITKECVEYVATGPKSYSLKYSNADPETKSKGFHLSHANSKIINHETMVHMVKNLTDQIDNKYAELTYNVIRKQRKNGKHEILCPQGLETRVETKIYAKGWTNNLKGILDKLHPEFEEIQDQLDEVDKINPYQLRPEGYLS